MALFVNGVAPVALYIGEEQVVQVYLGTHLVYDGTMPAVVFAPRMIATATATVPVPHAGTTVAVPRMLATADVAVPAVAGAARILAPAMTATAESVAAVVSVPVTVEVPAMVSVAALGSDVEAGALAQGHVLSPRLEATAEMLAPTVSAGVVVSVPPMTASVDAILAAIGGAASITPSGPYAATAAALAPAATAGANVVVPRATATAAGVVPVVGGAAAVTVPAATATAQMAVPTATSFVASGMTKSGNQSWATSSQGWVTVATWTANTGTYPGSTVTSDRLVLQGGKTSATLTAEAQWSASLNNTHTLRLVDQSGTVIHTGTGVQGTSGTCNATTTGVNLTGITSIGIQMSCSALNSGTLQAAGTFLTIT